MDSEVAAAARRVAKQISVPEAHWLAVVEVESAGKAFAVVDGGQKPVIRFEGHIFYRLLGPGPKRDQAVKSGLAHAKWGVVKNPASQQKRWDKLIKPAMKIDRVAALSACSVGLGQVLLSHWKAFGLGSVDTMLEMAGTVEGQLMLMATFCRVNHIVDEIQRGDWRGFARVYNGPAYASHGYHTKLAKAAKKWGGASASSSDGLLTVGSVGARVREVQALLARGGFYSGEVDGDFGPATREGVKRFQKAHRLTIDGKVGAQTWTALIDLRQSPDEQPGAVSVVETPLATAEGRQGAGIGLIGTGAGAAGNQIQGVADQISSTGISSPIVSYLSTGLYIVAGILIIAGLSWAAWGYFKANRA